MGSGKGKTEYIPAPATDTGTEAMMGMMMEYMGAMSEAMSASMEAMSKMTSEFKIESMPDIYEPPKIDWAEKEAQLAQKSKADYALETARKHGTSKTILTSPLLDDEDADTTHSIIAGR